MVVKLYLLMKLHWVPLVFIPDGGNSGMHKGTAPVFPR